MASDRSLVFVDTSFFKALADDQDSFYDRSLKTWSNLKEELVKLATSNFVLDETFTLVRVRRNLEIAIKFREFLSQSPLTLDLVRVTIEDEVEAWPWFLKEWSDLSFTDCVSFALMKRLGISRVATFDKHFARAGFKIEK